jgi:hypothetical protein
MICAMSLHPAILGSYSPEGLRFLSDMADSIEEYISKNVK